MKNLVLLTETRHCTSSAKEGDYIISQVPNPNADHDDPEFAETSESFHYLLTPSGTLSGVSSKDAITWSLDLNSFLDQDDHAHRWFHISHEENSDSIVCLSLNGAIISASSDGTNVELIGCFDHGIRCAAWSADKEFLAIITFQPQETDESILVPVLMTMNTQFEILSEVPLPHHMEEEAISVCWNKKTDNQLIAVSTHDSQDNTRKIRIFKGESLENVATGRTEDGSGKLIPNILAHADIAWAGSNTSNMLACVQRKGRKGRNIVFLEPNGLQHGGFKLEHRLDHEEVVRMDWNAESDLLAITLVGKANDNLQYGKVQFYHRNNYHWYLKHEIQLPDGVKVSCVRFDEIKGYHVSISLQHTVDASLQEWRDYKFIWDTSTTSQKGTTAVIDGNHVNLTMLDKAMIPPPMFASQITFDKSVAGISYVPSYLKCDAFDMLVHLSDNTLAFCDSSRIVACVNLSDAMNGDNDGAADHIDASCLRQFITVNSRIDGDKIVVKVLSIACSKASVSGGGPSKVEELVELRVEMCLNEEDSVSTIALTNCIVLEGKVLRLVNWSDSADTECETSSRGKGGALIELLDGSLFQYTSSDDLHVEGKVMPCEAETMLLEPCPWIAGLYAAGGRQLIIGLSSRFRLYFGERQLCDASSSFILSPTHEFLGYVTLGSRSQLRFLPLKVLLDFDPLMGSEENLDVFAEGYEPRNVERGSTLVAILPENPSAVLQLPRGNLEGVYPRALVLPHIMILINDGRYHSALDMMRRQKVDMNLIVDMDPHKFLVGGGLAKMVDQVQKMDHLNLFLASLQDYDITEWKYRIPPWLRFQESREIRAESRNVFDFSTKVNQVCSKIRLLMMEREANGQYLLPILSTFAKQSPPQLHNALELIKENAEDAASKTNGAKVKSSLLADHAQSSIKYLAFLADYELLFDTALGMYDFDLAKAVARNSQMDPKVYLPMLKRLRNLPVYEAKYEVDVRLKRYESALRHLYRMGVPEFDADSEVEFSSDHFIKCKRFIEEQKLHQLGLELFIAYPCWHQEIMLSLGESLLRESKGELSLAIFLSTKPPCYEGARKAARICGDYKTFFSCFSFDELTSKEDLLEVADDVAHEIADGRGGVLSKRDGSAAGARILLDYCEDIEGAVDLLIRAQMWFEARRLARLKGEKEVEKQIIDASVSYAKECLSDFESRAENFVEANERYAEVVVIRRKAKAEGVADDDEQNDETGSLFSMASHASNSSMRSNMSASSVGSVTSVSSVISAGTASTFSLINNESSIRHKSKFNNIGKKKKKKKRTRRERLGLKPGSEEELQSLVTKLKVHVIDAELSQIIFETIRFLSQVDKVSIALEVFAGYEALKSLVETNQLDRIHKDAETLKDEEKIARKEGQFFENTILECEGTVNDLRCVESPALLQSLSQYKINLY